MVRLCIQPARRVYVRWVCSLALLGSSMYAHGASAKPVAIAALPHSIALSGFSAGWRSTVSLGGRPSRSTVAAALARRGETNGIWPNGRSLVVLPIAVSSATPAIAQVVPTPALTGYSLSAAWPMAGHDPGQSYADAFGSVLPGAVSLLHLRWQAQGVTPQVEAQGVVYSLDADGNVESLDTAAGRPRLRYQSTGVIGLAYQPPYLYVNRSSEIRIVDAATGNLTSSATDNTGGATPSFSSLIVSGRQIFTGAGASQASTTQFYAFDAQSGNKIWQFPGSYTSTPCLAYGTLYVSYGAFGSADSYAIDAANGYLLREIKHLGAIQWDAAGDGVYASVLAGSTDRLRASVRAYDRFGKLRWVAHDILFGAALPTIMFGIAPGAVDARSAVDGHRLWKTVLPGLSSVSTGTVAVSGSLVVVQSADGLIRLLDRDTGTLLRTLRPPFAASAARNLLVGGGIIFESVKPTLPGGSTGPTTLLAFGP